MVVALLLMLAATVVTNVMTLGADKHAGPLASLYAAVPIAGRALKPALPGLFRVPTNALFFDLAQCASITVILTIQWVRRRSPREVTMTYVVEVLRQEHRNIEKLLRVLERELSVFDRDDRQNYEVVVGIID